MILDPTVLPEEFDLIAMAVDHPWAPIGMRASGRQGESALLRAWRGHPPLNRIIDLNAPDSRIAEAFRKALADGGPAGPDEVAEYLVERCGGAKFTEAVRATLLGHGRPPLSTRHGVFKRRGELTGKDFLALYRLTRAISLPGRLKIGDAAMMVGRDGRTLDAYRRKLLPNVSWEVARSRFGWRWLIEEVLQVHGYVEEVVLKEA